MPIGYNKFTRRQFLIDAGGYGLLIPLLPSLMSREARAQAMNTAPRRLMVMTYDHNIMASENISPAVATNAIGTGVKATALSTYTGSMGNFLTHPTIASIKNAGLMTIVRGLDSLMTPDAHGATWLTGGNINDGKEGVPMAPSFDSYIEASSSVYPAGQAYFKKVLRCNGSVSYQKVGSQVAFINNCYQEDDPNRYNGANKLYNDMLSLFKVGSSPTTTTTLPPTAIQGPILNKVFSAYQSVKNSRMISAEDKARLDNHLQLISELQGTFLTSTGGSGGGGAISQALNCTNPVTDTSMPGKADLSYYDKMIVYMKLISMALSCNLTKASVLVTESNASYDIGASQTSFPGGGVTSFHSDVIHNEHGYALADIQRLYSYWLRWHMDRLSELVLGPLQATQDPLNSNGKSILENMLVAVLSEAGVNTNPGAHVNLDYQPILFGNMGGVIKSDQFVVFDRGTSGRGVGIPYNQLAITLMQAMGLSESEYVAGSSDAHGFGVYPAAGKTPYDVFRSRFYSPISEIWRG